MAGHPKLQCINCTDQVTIRNEREGVIHKNGKYGCRTKRDGKPCCADVADQAALVRLSIGVSVKIPAQDKDRD